MASTTRRYGRDPKEVFTTAAESINELLAQELERATDVTVSFSKSLAPVYNPAKYPKWAHMPHAMQPHGLLKKSIRRTKVKVGKRVIKTSIRSSRNYAGYIEDGFIHKYAKRRVSGRKYVGTPMNLVHKPMFTRGIVRAFRRAFKEGS